MPRGKDVGSRSEGGVTPKIYAAQTVQTKRRQYGQRQNHQNVRSKPGYEQSSHINFPPYATVQEVFAVIPNMPDRRWFYTGLAGCEILGQALIWLVNCKGIKKGGKKCSQVTAAGYRR